MMTATMPEALSALSCGSLSLGEWGNVRLRDTAEGNVEQGKESTWISLLPLIRAENKTELQLEVRSM